ncbi:MAG: sensor histidine kinase [Streptosporangiaceae bacterium]
MSGILTAVLGGLAGVLLVVVVVLGVRLRHVRQDIRRDLLVVRDEQTKLQASAEDLRRSNYELEQFAYLASHDLQEPLRKVASFCQLLQRRYAAQLDARANQYIDFAVDGAQRMQALINDLLAFSRVGQAAPEPMLVSSDSALTHARANLADELEKSGATIEAGHLPLVLAEMSLLTAVFQNLLSNALKFAGEGHPRIVVTARRQEQFWLFSFTDYGMGVDPQYAERIFVLFQRLNDRSYAGTGIGLAMCRKIIENFGGRIWLDTTVAEGTRFCFTLLTPAETDEELPPGPFVAMLPERKDTDA